MGIKSNGRVTARFPGKVPEFDQLVLAPTVFPLLEPLLSDQDAEIAEVCNMCINKINKRGRVKW